MHERAAAASVRAAIFFALCAVGVAAWLLGLTVSRAACSPTDIPCRVAVEYPAINSPSTSDFEKTNILRQWAYTHSDVSDAPNVVDNTPGIGDNFYSYTVPEMTAVFDNDQAGIWCGGAGWYLMKIYQMYGYEAGQVGVGIDSKTLGAPAPRVGHVLTVVKLNDGRVIFQDAYLNYAFVQPANSAVPLTTAEVITLLKNHQDGQIGLLNGPTGRDYMVNDSLAAGWEGQPHPHPAYLGPYPHFISVRSNLSKVHPSSNVIMSAQSFNDHWYPLSFPAGIVAEGHPNKLVYILLYPLWAHEALGRQVLDQIRAAGAVKYSPGWNWSPAHAGVTAPASVGLDAPFTVTRTYEILDANNIGSHTIRYFASSDQTFGNADDQLLASETVATTANGTYTGQSPQLTIGNPGQQYLFSVLDANLANTVRAAVMSPITVTGTLILLDDGGPAYTHTSGWMHWTGEGVYGNDIEYAAAGNGSAKATWQKSGLDAGHHDVLVSWAAHTNRATNAPYEIYDGNTLVATTTIDQQQAAQADKVTNGINFQKLGTYPVTSGTLKVVLSNNANGYVIADAVQVHAGTPPLSSRIGSALER